MGFSLKAAWNYKCPKCRQGDIYVKPFDLAKPLAMPQRCEYCDQKTEPEPGFYFGAMFISYILSAWFLLLPTLLLVFGFDWSGTAAISFTLFLAAITYFKFLRGSRALWLHLMVRHDPEAEATALQTNLEKVNKARDWKPRAERNKQK